MSIIKQKIYRSVFISLAVITLALMVPVEQAHAVWPPFKYDLIPQYADGEITYFIKFRKTVDWNLTNFIVKIPMPEGTEFVDATTIPTLEASFDGESVTFSAPVFSDRYVEGDAFFSIRVVDPEASNVVTHMWISWEGLEPGSFLTQDYSIDVSKQVLSWEEPAQPRLQLETKAMKVGDEITYLFYPSFTRGPRMWDLKINVPIPEGTEFLSAETPDGFTASFNGQEVSYTTIELKPRVELEPLKLKVTLRQSTNPIIVTHAWATWKNSSKWVGRAIDAQEELRTGDILVQADSSQWVVSDLAEDVPFSNYDLASVAFQRDGTALRSTFFTTGSITPRQPIQFRMSIDIDCDQNTGSRWVDPDKRKLGVEYQIIYANNTGRASLVEYDSESKKWAWKERTYLSAQIQNQQVSVWLPYELIGNKTQFCWVVEGQNTTTAFTLPLPVDYLVDDNFLMPELADNGSVDLTSIENAAQGDSFRNAGVFVEEGDIWRFLPGWEEPSGDWTAVDFDDIQWYSGPARIGYGVKSLATDLAELERPSQLLDASILTQRTVTQAGVVLAVLPSEPAVGSVYMRRSFAVENPAGLAELKFKAQYRGGFVAYLNGHEIARYGEQNGGAKPSSDIDLTPFIDDLVAGTNVLAIQVFTLPEESKFFMNPKLSWKLESASETYYAGGGPTVDITGSPDVEVDLSLINGKLAIPIDNGQGDYDIFIFSLPEGEILQEIPYARQPNFHPNGQRLLINREGNGVENVFEYDLDTGLDKQVSDSPSDWYPVYDLWGNRVAYGNDQLAMSGITVAKVEDGDIQHHNKTGKVIFKGQYASFIFLQCSLKPPHLEDDTLCRDVSEFGVLIPAGQMGDLRGTHPVWTSDDHIVYKGCNTWAGSVLCGIYKVPSASTKAFSDGFIPGQLTRESEDTPSDTKGNWIAFSSHRDGDWEAYLMDLNGDNVRNLSNSPFSNDGLPSISPDQNWVAFVSDRDGQWAVWVVSASGGTPQKLFDLPTDTPWGNGDRSWLTERISWGP